jgi:organic hydroperoxide reductase OsmC/OhrA
MLWYLHLCSLAGVVATEYKDNATGNMKKTENGGGQFTEVTLNPIVTVSDKSIFKKANELQIIANALCFIANSVNFPVHHNQTAKTK